jgi:hypothetical protein
MASEDEVSSIPAKSSFSMKWGAKSKGVRVYKVIRAVWFTGFAGEILFRRSRGNSR